MLSKIIEEGGNVEVRYICFAADLLQRMMWQLQCLEASYFELALAMAAGVGLIRTPDGYGVVDPELPFEGRKTTLRLEALKQEQSKIAKLHNAGDMKEFSRLTMDAYRDLRKAWEGAIEEVLFSKVVMRFRKSIQTDRLNAVAVEEADYDEVQKGMTKCSNYVHDKATEGGTAVPDPSELLAGINALDKWRAKVDARSKVLVKKRQTAADAAAAASPGPTAGGP